MRAKVINETHTSGSKIKRLESEKVGYMELKKSDFRCGTCEYITEGGFCTHELVKSPVSVKHGCCNLYYPLKRDVVDEHDWSANRHDERSGDVYESLNEGSNKFKDEETEIKAQEIAEVIYSTYNGDDVDYEENSEDQERLEDALDEYFDTPDEIEELGDVDFVINNLTPEEIDNFHQILVDAGFIEKYYDDEEDTGVLDDNGNVIEDEMDRVDAEYDD
jgi:hypothetical protein